MSTGYTIKVHLPGESPWVEVIERGPDRMKGRILNKLFHQHSEHEQGRFTKRELGNIAKLPKLHNHVQGDEVWFVRDEDDDWVMEVREMSDFEHKLVSLLDRIEVEEDHTLASQRFALAEEQGYEVVVTDERTSGRMN